LLNVLRVKSKEEERERRHTSSPNGILKTVLEPLNITWRRECAYINLRELSEGFI
jgi:hypothetical protein